MTWCERNLYIAAVFIILCPIYWNYVRTQLYGMSSSYSVPSTGTTYVHSYMACLHHTLSPLLEPRTYTAIWRVFIILCPLYWNHVRTQLYGMSSSFSVPSTGTTYVHSSMACLHHTLSSLLEPRRTQLYGMSSSYSVLSTGTTYIHSSMACLHHSLSPLLELHTYTALWCVFIILCPLYWNYVHTQLYGVSSSFSVPSTGTTYIHSSMVCLHPILCPLYWNYVHTQLYGVSSSFSVPSTGTTYIHSSMACLHHSLSPLLELHTYTALWCVFIILCPLYWNYVHTELYGVSSSFSVPSTGTTYIHSSMACLHHTLSSLLELHTYTALWCVFIILCPLYWNYVHTQLYGVSSSYTFSVPSTGTTYIHSSMACLHHSLSPLLELRTYTALWRVFIILCPLIHHVSVPSTGTTYIHSSMACLHHSLSPLLELRTYTALWHVFIILCPLYWNYVHTQLYGLSSSFSVPSTGTTYIHSSMGVSSSFSVPSTGTTYIHSSMVCLHHSLSCLLELHMYTALWCVFIILCPVYWNYVHTQLYGVSSSFSVLSTGTTYIHSSMVCLHHSLSSLLELRTYTALWCVFIILCPVYWNYVHTQLYGVSSSFSVPSTGTTYIHSSMVCLHHSLSCLLELRTYTALRHVFIILCPVYWNYVHTQLYGVSSSFSVLSTGTTYIHSSMARLHHSLSCLLELRTYTALWHVFIILCPVYWNYIHTQLYGVSSSFSVPSTGTTYIHSSMVCLHHSLSPLLELHVHTQLYGVSSSFSVPSTGTTYIHSSMVCLHHSLSPLLELRTYTALWHVFIILCPVYWNYVHTQLYGVSSSFSVPSTGTTYIHSSMACLHHSLSCLLELRTYTALWCVFIILCPVYWNYVHTQLYVFIILCPLYWNYIHVSVLSTGTTYIHSSMAVFIILCPLYWNYIHTQLYGVSSSFSVLSTGTTYIHSSMVCLHHSLSSLLELHTYTALWHVFIILCPLYWNYVHTQLYGVSSSFSVYPLLELHTYTALWRVFIILCPLYWNYIHTQLYGRVFIILCPLYWNYVHTQLYGMSSSFSVLSTGTTYIHSSMAHVFIILCPVLELLEYVHSSMACLHHSLSPLLELHTYTALWCVFIILCPVYWNYVHTQLYGVSSSFSVLSTGTTYIHSSMARLHHSLSCLLELHTYTALWCVFTGTTYIHSSMSPLLELRTYTALWRVFIILCPLYWNYVRTQLYGVSSSFSALWCVFIILCPLYWNYIHTQLYGVSSSFSVPSTGTT